MILATLQLQLGTTDQTVVECYVCKLYAECLYRYDLGRGYFKVSEDRRIELDMSVLKKCRLDGTRMYIAEFMPGGQRLWHCALVGCKGDLVKEEAPL
jgi:hypothetical protein